MKIIARIHTPYKEKFGIPRQSGICDKITSKIVFEKEFRRPEALMGLEGYSHLWVIWNFSESEREDFSPTVRPPRLGGNKRMGVFATRSPFRPNPIGLSSLKIERIEKTGKEGTVIFVRGADMLDGTPIYDIKPYIPFTDSHPEARGGFADEVFDYSVAVDFPKELLEIISPEYREALCEILAGDPRPSYKKDGERVYGMRFAEYEIFFKVSDGTLAVCDVAIYNK